MITKDDASVPVKISVFDGYILPLSLFGVIFLGVVYTLVFQPAVREAIYSVPLIALVVFMGFYVWFAPRFLKREARRDALK